MKIVPKQKQKQKRKLYISNLYVCIYVYICIDNKDTQAAKLFGDECANILERSINGVLNKNALLYFAYADFEEGRMKYDKVHSMYNKFLSIPDIDPTLVKISSKFQLFQFYFLLSAFLFSGFFCFLFNDISFLLGLCAIYEICPSS